VLRIDARKRKEVTLTLLLAGGASRVEAESALLTVLDNHWPQTPASADSDVLTNGSATPRAAIQKRVG
jgi:hypothetical protein